MKRHTLQDLFIEELRDMYDAERQLVKSLPKMAKAAGNEQLRQGFEQHLTETERQVNRLEQVFDMVGQRARGKSCEAMKGLVEEGKQIMDREDDTEVRDAGLIAAAQKVEHYEIASYGCLCTWAQQLGFRDAQRLLHDSLEEEKRTDEKLTELAESHVNISASKGEGQGNRSKAEMAHA
jgi:ferritin-like metal-binding protein YciE